MGNKIQVSFLVVDDDADQEEIIKQNIVAKLKEYEIDYILIDPGDFFDVKTSKLDEQGFLDYVFERTKGKTIQVIASDCNLITTGDYKLHGIDIVSLLMRETRKDMNRPFILYSGQLKETTKHLLTKIHKKLKENIEKEDYDIESIEVLKNLINAKIRFSGRNQNSYCDDIISVIKKEIDVEGILLASFNQYGLTEINIGNGDYDGITLEQMVELIDKNDTKGLRFTKEFIELAIGHFTTLNA